MHSIPKSRPSPQRVLDRWSIYLIFCVTMIAVAVLAGWQWDILLLTRPAPGTIATNPVTAVTFLLASISLLLIIRKPSRIGQNIGSFLALLVLLIGCARLIGYGFPGWTGIDQLLYTSRTESLAFRPNRMAITSAECFLLVGLAVLLLKRFPGEQTRVIARYSRWRDIPAVITLTLGLVTCMGYLYRVKELASLLTWFPMSLYTAVAFLLIALALLFASAGYGVLNILTGPLIGSVTARRLVPVAILLPIILGLIRLYGYWLGYISTELGVTLLVLSIIICIVFTVLYNAHLLNKREEQRLQIEAALLAAESRWRSVVSSVKDYAIFLISPDGEVMSWNEGAQKIKGYRPEEIIGKAISIFYTPEEAASGVPGHNLELAALNGSHQSEGWRVRKDGSRFWAEIVFTPIYDQHQRLQAFAKITRDTTEQKLAQEKIAYLARLIEDTSDAIFSIGKDGAIKSWNRSAELLFGWPASEVIGKQTNELMRPQISEEVRQPIRRQLEEVGYWKGEIVYLDHSGEKRTILQSVSNARGLDGKPDGYVIVGRDVTNWKKVEDQLRQFNTLLETQVKEKTAEITRSNNELRALASHLQDIREEERAAMAREVHDELGQQLTGLKMDLAHIGRRLSSADTAWLMEKTQQTMALLDTTIRTVRKIATELRPSILDDLGLVAAIDWQGQEFMKRSGVTTHFRSGLAAVDLPPAVAIGLFRICQESLTNIGRHAAADHVSIVLNGDDEQLCLTISDDGRGIDLQKAGNGKTLGLLGMKERAQMMGGTLHIDSLPGKGLTLSVAIPLLPTPKP